MSYNKRCLCLTLYPKSQCGFLVEALISPEMDQTCWRNVSLSSGIDTFFGNYLAWDDIRILLYDLESFHSILIFIGPESDHWLCLSLTHWLTDSLTNSCLVNLIDVSLACEDANSKLVEVVTVADVDNEDRVGISLLQIWGWGLDIKLNFCSDFEHKVWSRVWSWSSSEILNLKYGQYFASEAWWGYEVDVWSRFWS